MNPLFPVVLILLLLLAGAVVHVFGLRAQRERLIEFLPELHAQRDAWKSEAEYQYGLLRTVLRGDDIGCQVTGVLDKYAAGKYPALRPIGDLSDFQKDCPFPPFKRGY